MRAHRAPPLLHYPCVQDPFTGLTRIPVGPAMTRWQAVAYLKQHYPWRWRNLTAAAIPCHVIDGGNDGKKERPR